MVLRTLALLMFGIGTIHVGQTPAPLRFRLFAIDKSCVCVNTKKQTRSINSSETQSGRIVEQVFKSTAGRELFRVVVGNVTNSGIEKLWNYGIAEEADFNGDGRPDYSWYGGDDTREAMYIFLSSNGTYSKVDVIKTAQAAWSQQFGATAPNLSKLGGTSRTGTMTLERTQSGLVLIADIERDDATGKDGVQTVALRVQQANFKP